MLHRDHERELDGLARDHQRIGVVALRRDVLQQVVRIRLQPQDLAAGRLARALLERVEAGVRGDPVQPRPHGGAALEGGALAPRAQERLLRQILGLLE
jgi:hypothetical protein